MFRRARHNNKVLLLSYPAIAIEGEKTNTITALAHSKMMTEHSDCDFQIAKAPVALAPEDRVAVTLQGGPSLNSAPMALERTL